MPRARGDHRKQPESGASGANEGNQRFNAAGRCHQHDQSKSNRPSPSSPLLLIRPVLAFLSISLHCIIQDSSGSIARPIQFFFETRPSDGWPAKFNPGRSSRAHANGITNRSSFSVLRYRSTKGAHLERIHKSQLNRFQLSQSNARALL